MSLGVDHHVVWLKVSVDNLIAVQILQNYE